MASARNQVCELCAAHVVEGFCTCADRETLLCDSCALKHMKQFGQNHAYHPIASLLYYRIPGYFERLQARMRGFTEVERQVTESAAKVEEATVAFSRLVEKLIRDLTMFAKTARTQQRKTKEAFKRDMEDALEEVRLTMNEDQPRFRSRYGELFRDMAQTYRQVQLFEYTLSLPPDSANLVTLRFQFPENPRPLLSLSEDPEDTNQLAGVPDMMTPEAKAKLAQLPPFLYDLRVALGQKKGPIRLADGSVYVGEWQGDRPYGKGRLYTVEGGLMEGYWDEELHWKGREILPTGDLYEGEYVHGKKQGTGRFENLQKTYSYEGGWLDDMKHGRCMEYISDGSTYEGSFEQDEKSGFGKFIWAAGEIYTGEFRNNLIHGQGKYVWMPETKWYNGDWIKGQMHGKGKFVNEGKEYEGDFKEDKKHGYGVYRWDGNVYEGEFVDNKMHGKGYLTMKGKERRLYAFENNKRGALLD